MKRQNQIAMALLATNAIIFTAITLNKTYDLQMGNLSKQFINLKKKIKQNKQLNYQKMLEEILIEISKKIDPLENLIKKGFQTDLQKSLDSFYIDPKLKQFLQNKLEILFSNQNDMIKQAKPMPIKVKNHEIISPVMNMPLKEISVIQTQMDTLPNNKEPNIFKILLGTMACVIALNTPTNLASTNTNDAFVLETIEDIEFFFKTISLSENSSLTQSMPYLETDERIQNILASDKSYEEKFNYILILNGISLEEKIEIILQSKDTNDINIFQFLSSKTNIPVRVSMNHIIHSDTSNPSTILNFILTSKSLTLEEKVWYALLIPNISFETVLKSLLTIENASQDQIVKYIMNSDLVSFKTLMDTLLQLPNISSEKIVEYISYYQISYKDNFDTAYNAISLKSLEQYINNIEILSEDEKVDLIWNLLEEYTLDDKIQLILDFYEISYQDYIKIYYSKQNELTEKNRIILKLFERVNLEKEEYILKNYNFQSKDQLDILIAGCAAEGKKNYDDLYWVANIFFNRITNPKYANAFGINPYSQFIAKGQFEVYWNETYKDYLNNSSSENNSIFALAKQALYDMFYLGYDGIEHSYLEFRSWDTTDFSNIYIVKGGNRYKFTMNEATRIIYENLLEDNRIEINSKQKRTRKKD